MSFLTGLVYCEAFVSSVVPSQSNFLDSKPMLLQTSQFNIDDTHELLQRIASISMVHNTRHVDEYSHVVTCRLCSCAENCLDRTERGLICCRCMVLCAVASTARSTEYGRWCRMCSSLLVRSCA